MYTLNCRGKLITLERPKIMGILNLTPNSFYDGGKYQQLDAVISQAEKMIEEGAEIIDIGGYSTQPNAPEVSEDEELKRLATPLEKLIQTFPKILFSVDTFRSAVAKETLEIGAHIINDVSGGQLDENMYKTVGQFDAPYILMHMRGTPKTMQSLTSYEDIIKEMAFYFSEKKALAHQNGIKDVIIDPGFGFAKTREQNFKVLQQLDYFEFLDCPVLTALSRKSMIYKTLNHTPQEALNGTTALHMVALLKNSKILRVHDVKEAKECVTLYEQLIHS